MPVWDPVHTELLDTVTAGGDAGPGAGPGAGPDAGDVGKRARQGTMNYRAPDWRHAGPAASTAAGSGCARMCRRGRWVPAGRTRAPSAKTKHGFLGARDRSRRTNGAPRCCLSENKKRPAAMCDRRWLPCPPCLGSPDASFLPRRCLGHQRSCNLLLPRAHYRKNRFSPGNGWMGGPAAAGIARRVPWT